MIDCSARGHTSLPALIPMDATNLYLDDNTLGNILQGTAFIGRKKIASLFLNSSRITGLSNRTLAGLQELQILHLENNLIRHLVEGEFSNLTNLRELHLHHNLLTSIQPEIFLNLTNLQVGRPSFHHPS